MIQAQLLTLDSSILDGAQDHIVLLRGCGGRVFQSVPLTVPKLTLAAWILHVLATGIIRKELKMPQLADKNNTLACKC